MFAKRFFYVSAAILCLALTYHLGARSATAQGVGSTIVGFTYDFGGYAQVMTSNRDLFIRGFVGSNSFEPAPARYLGNFWEGATPATQESWGGVKARYRGERQPATTDR